MRLSQLPALSMLLRDSTATPPGRASLFAIAHQRQQEPGARCRCRPGNLSKVNKKKKEKEETSVGRTDGRTNV